ICVTAVSGNLDAQVDPRFGRCQYFVIVDPDTMEFEAIPNEGVGAASGAGIQAAQTIVDKGVNVLISGNIGPNAFQTLSAAGVKVVTGASGTVRDAIEMYRSGRLRETGSATVPAHAGMGGNFGMGRGRGFQAVLPYTPKREENVEGLMDRLNKLEEELKEAKKLIEELKNKRR
ncbi:MAG: NifB/NifX family molybdenum-iron cluster-binding protein, partial [Candidatus Syntropharchaeia archaeon]